MRWEDAKALLQAHSRLLTLAVSGLSLGGIVAAGLLFTDSDPRRAVLLAIASSFLSVSLVGLLADTFLKSSLIDYVMEKVELRDDFRRLGVDRALIAASPEWEALFQGARQVELLLVDPHPWIEQNWRHVQAEAEHRAVVIALLVPRPGTPACAELTNRLGRDVTVSIHDATNHVATEWLAAKTAKRINPKSTIGFHSLDVAPAYTIVRAIDVTGTRRAAFILNGTMRPVRDRGPIAITGSASPGDDSNLVGWIEAQLASLTLAATRFWAGSGAVELTDPVYAPDEQPPTPTGAGA
jgi:hypothetical protein